MMSNPSHISNINKTVLLSLLIITLLGGIVLAATSLSVAGAADTSPISSSNTDTITITINDSSNGRDTATTSEIILNNTDSPVGAIPGVGSGNAPIDNDGDDLYEDVNGDGTTNFTDAVDLAFADFTSLTPAQQSALDFDGDNDVDFDDAVELAFNV